MDHQKPSRRSFCHRANLLAVGAPRRHHSAGPSTSLSGATLNSTNTLKEFGAHQYGRVILPMTVLRRLDCVLKPTKQAVLEKARGTDVGPILEAAAGQHFYNTSRYDFQKLLGDAG